MDIEISIVSGTYNRIAYLQKMVDSVRRSIGVGIPYEIVLVDGGSTDGTQDWCKTQEDIVLVEQRTLLGAVRAFNVGFRKARGRYVIIGNDDIEFIHDSILCAYIQMQDNPSIGVGCFYQDRDGLPFHVGHMRAINKNSEPVTVHYGQVCIVPKFLGDKVGWWGKYLRTYGGDNELSANILGYGYRVVPLHCACIHDLKVDDELRQMNYGDPKERKGKHPDTIKFQKRWEKGIRVGELPEHFQCEKRKFRIFYAPIYSSQFPWQKKNKDGLRKALQNIGSVVEHDYRNEPVDELLMRAEAFQPDLFVLQVHDTKKIDKNVMRSLRSDHPNSTFFHWNGDFHPEIIYRDDYMSVLEYFDVCSFVAADEQKTLYNRRNINWTYIPHSWEDGWSEPSPDDPIYDVIFLGNGYSKERKHLAKYLHEFCTQHRLKLGLFGSWRGLGIPFKDSTIYDFAEGVRLMRSARFVISDQQWPHAAGYASNRLVQSLHAGGGVVLQQRFDKMTEMLGYVNKEHLLVWDSYKELGSLILEYRHEDTKREEISKRGKEFVDVAYTFDAFVTRMLKAVQNAREA